METSLGVQPDDTMGRLRDGENNPLERPQASEEEDEMFADVTSYVDLGEISFFKPGL